MANKLGLTEQVMAFQSGSRDAFEKLVRRFQNFVTSVAYAKIGDVQRSEDIAQQTFLLAWQKHAELKDPDRFAGWLRGIANNLARNDNRLKANVQANVQQSADVESSSQEEPAIVDSSGLSPESALIEKEQGALLWSALERIPLKYREPMVLYYREEQSVQSVAQHLQLSQDAVKQRLKRGRGKLRKEIELQIEEFLIQTRPDEKFSSVVIAALPAVGAKVGATAVKTGVAVGGKLVGAKVAGGKVAGAAAGAFSIAGIMAGAAWFLGVGIGWLKTKREADRSTSEEEKSLHWRLFHELTLVGLVTLLAYLCVSAFLKGQISGGVFCVFLPFFMHYASVRSKRKELRLHQLYHAHGKPAHRKGTSRANELFGDHLDKAAAGGDGIIGIIGGLIGAWSWLLLLLLVGAFVHLAFLPCFLIGVGLFVWLWWSAEKEAPSYKTYPDCQRFMGRFMWKACLVESAFCASLLLLILSPSIGKFVLSAFQTNFTMAGFGKSMVTLPQSVGLLWGAILLTLSLGALMKWVMYSNAEIFEEYQAFEKRRSDSETNRRG